MSLDHSRSFENGSIFLITIALAWLAMAPLVVSAEPLPVSHPRPDDSWYLDPGKARWSFQNLDQIIPVAAVSRGDSQTVPMLYAGHQILDDLYTSPEGVESPLGSILDALEVDGFIALKNGVVVGEAYFNDMQPQTQHLVFSVTKSLVGVLIGTMVDDNLIDPERAVTRYLPELKGTGFEGATVQDLLDMVAATEWNKVRSDPTSLVNVNAMAGGFIAHPEEFEFDTTIGFPGVAR